jgi:FAD-dependent urate hydroxylase
MRIAIAGAGIGGLAVARGLHLAGHDVHVYEQAPGLRTDGGSVSIWNNGMGILTSLGVDVQGAGQRIDAIEQRRSTGSLVARTDVASLGRRFGSFSATMPRRVLLERLYDALPEGTVSFGSQVSGVDGQGRLVPAGDEAIAADVVIGADGARSAVRASLLGDAPPYPTGWVTWQGMTPVPIDVTTSHTSQLFVGPEGFCGLLPCGEGLLQWFFDVRYDVTRPPPADLPAFLRERFGAWAEPVPTVLTGARAEDLAYFPHFVHDVPPVWGSGRCTLLGDAVHLMPPSVAQGANQALEDAWVLSRTLDAGPDPAEQLRQYEQARRRRAAGTAAMAARSTAQTDGPLQLLGYAPDRFITWMFGTMLRLSSNYLTGGGPSAPRRGATGDQSSRVG